MLQHTHSPLSLSLSLSLSLPFPLSLESPSRVSAERREAARDMEDQVGSGRRGSGWRRRWTAAPEADEKVPPLSVRCSPSEKLLEAAAAAAGRFWCRDGGGGGVLSGKRVIPQSALGESGGEREEDRGGSLISSTLSNPEPPSIAASPSTFARHSVGNPKFQRKILSVHPPLSMSRSGSSLSLSQEACLLAPLGQISAERATPFLRARTSGRARARFAQLIRKRPLRCQNPRRRLTIDTSAFD